MEQLPKSRDNPVLHRHLQLPGNREHILGTSHSSRSLLSAVAHLVACALDMRTGARIPEMVVIGANTSNGRQMARWISRSMTVFTGPGMRVCARRRA